MWKDIAMLTKELRYKLGQYRKEKRRRKPSKAGIVDSDYFVPAMH